ncbi:unnamed protein product [Cylicocyclus nassatus]|uniref:Uncharacterized protein n=1 Tax=Cylicocyclus nassatus TaxID=53992 RepID=A0AA36H3F9_CYLNA|nr:unnamed protein product [Cylicocyclus nassatus]
MYLQEPYTMKAKILSSIRESDSCPEKMELYLKDIWEELEPPSKFEAASQLTTNVTSLHSRVSFRHKMMQFVFPVFFGTMILPFYHVAKNVLRYG